MKTIILIAVLILTTSTAQAGNRDIFKLLLPNLISANETKYDLPKGLLGALIQVESAGKIKAYNKDDGNSATKAKGVVVPSHGLVQMQLGTARFIQAEHAKAYGIKLKPSELITVKELMRPEVNVEYGAMYLRYLLKTHKNDVSWALSCYNGGLYSKSCKKGKYIGKYVGKVFNAWSKNDKR